MWGEESDQYAYQTLSVVLGCVRRFRNDMWLCKQGAQAQCPLPHHHAGNTLNMVVLPRGQCKRADKCLSCMHTHSYTRKKALPYMYPRRTLWQLYVDGMGGYLDTSVTSVNGPITPMLTLTFDSTVSSCCEKHWLCISVRVLWSIRVLKQQNIAI